MERLQDKSAFLPMEILFMFNQFNLEHSPATHITQSHVSQVCWSYMFLQTGIVYKFLLTEGNLINIFSFLILLIVIIDIISVSKRMLIAHLQ